MFIISLYHIDLKPLPHKPQRFTYGQSLINHIKGFRTLIVGNRLPAGLQPLLPHALPCRITQIDRAFKQASRFADGDVACIRQLWGKRFMQEGISGLQTRPSRGHKPIMDCTDEEVVRKAIEQDRQSVSQTREAWQKATGKEASDLTFKRFYQYWRKANKKTPKGSTLASTLCV